MGKAFRYLKELVKVILREYTRSMGMRPHEPFSMEGKLRVTFSVKNSL